MRSARRRTWAGIVVLLIACACTTVLIVSFGALSWEARTASASNIHPDDAVLALLATTTTTTAQTRSGTSPEEEAISSDTSLPPTPFVWQKNEYTEYCYYVEDICRSSHRWFYKPDPHKRQPDVIWDTDHPDVWPPNPETVYQRSYRFQRQRQRQHSPEDRLDRTNGTARFSEDECPTSPVTNHVRN
jgi:hypothetical protein